MPKTHHPALVEACLQALRDRSEAQPVGCYPSAHYTDSPRLSVKVTRAMRQRCSTMGEAHLEPAKVMTHNRRGNYWEVTGTTVTEILKDHPDVLARKVQGRWRFAWKAAFEAAELRNNAADVSRKTAAARTSVVKGDTAWKVLLGADAVATFNHVLLGEELAGAMALSALGELRKALAKQLMDEAVAGCAA